MQLLEALIGAIVIWIALNDVFSSVVVPRPTPSRYRPAGIFIRVSWRLWRRLAEGAGNGTEQRLGVYAPLALVCLVALWLAMLMLGFGLVFHSVADQLRPPLADLPTAIYFAAIALLTIGFGDVVPVGGLARTLAIAAAVTGLAVVALTITYLFSLYGSLERRELLVTTLDERAGAPPSGVRLLEESARAGHEEDLPRLFERWEEWAAHLLDTHQAHPILMYFRSSHDRESWVGALGALLDAATLILTTLEGGPKGPAKAMRGVGAHTVEDLSRLLGLPRDRECGVERDEFDDAYARLAAAGHRLRPADPAWDDFSSSRADYAASLNGLARHFSVPPALWISDRTVLRHRP